MLDADLGLKRPATFTLAIRETFLVVMEELDIGTRLATLPLITQVNMVDFSVYINLKEEIVGMMVQDMELGIKIPANLHFKMLEKVLMVMGKVYIGLRPALIPPII